jgi:hypothetical protein
MAVAWIPPPRSARVGIYDEASAAAVLHPNAFGIRSPSASENARRAAGELLLDRGASAGVRGAVHAARRPRFTGEVEYRSGLLASAERYGDSSLLWFAGGGASRPGENDCRKDRGNCEYCNSSEGGFHVFLLVVVMPIRREFREEFTESSAFEAIATGSHLSFDLQAR